MTRVFLKTTKQAVKWYTLAAKQGYAQRTACNLGLSYDNGEGVPQDYKQAVKWYTLAAKQGHAKAQVNLGSELCARARVFAQDYVQAHMWATIWLLPKGIKRQWN